MSINLQMENTQSGKSLKRVLTEYHSENENSGHDALI